MMKRFDVDFYELEDGSCPVMDFLDSIGLKMRAKLLREMELLEAYGNELREPYSKYLGKQLFELRAKQGNNITRVIYFFMIDNKIIMTNGFSKKTGKTPKRVLDIAEKYRADYLLRKSRGEIDNE